MSQVLGYARDAAFTLIELLVVVAIILVLSSFILSMVTAASTSQDQQNTKALIITLTSAIDQFANETGAVPLPTGSKADPQSGSWYPDENAGSWSKQQLWWRLSADMDRDMTKLMRQKGEEADLLADPYQSSTYINDHYPSAARHDKISEIMATVPNELVEGYRGTYTDTSPPWLYAGKDVKASATKLSCRGVYKSIWLAAQGQIAKDLEQRKYKIYACLELDDLVSPSFLEEQTIVDAWGMPLIYAAHSTCAVKERRAKSGSTGLRYMGFKASGRQAMTDRDGSGFVDKADWSTAPVAAAQIDHNGDGTADVNDWGSVLWNARPGRSLQFYLASAGPDTFFNCLYYDDVNADNIEVDIE